MKKFLAKIMILVVCIFLTACGGNEAKKSEPNTVTTTPIDNSKSSEENSVDKEPRPSDSFEAGLLIDLALYKDQLPESDLPSLEVLENNLTALVEHDHALYQSAFENETLKDAMKYYYSEQFQYKFTDIESIELPKQHQVHITVIGQRLDTTNDIVEDVKMMYVLKPNNQGNWIIHMID